MTGVNVIFTGNLLYPEGLAGTKRLQHFIDGFMTGPGNSARVLLLRQSHPGRDSQKLVGEHHGVPYATIGADLGGSRILRAVWTYLISGARFLRRYRRPDVPNVLLLYGEPNIENLFLLLCGRLMGYRVICDIVEDLFLVPPNPSLSSRVKAWSGQWASRNIALIADGVIVISSFLKTKFDVIVGGRLPVILLPVSVDLHLVPASPAGFHKPIRVLYAGSFGDKDGVDTLIAGFDLIAHRWPAAELVMTGRGSPGRMTAVLRRAADSPFSERIHYLGFLSSEQYFEVVGSCDVACVVRVRSDFAERGFPFKLGEYLASGRPVITSRVGDVTEYLKDCVNAVLVDPGSATGIAAGLEYLFENEDRALAIGRAGRVVAEKCFSAHRVGEQLRDFVGQVASR